MSNDMNDIQFEESFYRRLVDDINKITDIRSKVITLHLYLEFLIDNFINAFFVNPREILENFSFYNKFRIIEAIGFDENLCKNIKKINSFRNQFAHELDLSKIKLDFSNVYMKEPEVFSKFNDLNKIQVLTVETILEMNNQFYKFLKWRGEVFKKV
jgi:hypothetical protein